MGDAVLGLSPIEALLASLNEMSSTVGSRCFFGGRIGNWVGDGLMVVMKVRFVFGVRVALKCILSARNGELLHVCFLL